MKHYSAFIIMPTKSLFFSIIIILSGFVCFKSFAQDTSQQSIICSDRVINGQIVKRCVSGPPPTYNRPAPPTIDLPPPLINMPAPPPTANPPINITPTQLPPPNNSPGRVLHDIDNTYTSGNYVSKLKVNLFGNHSAAIKFNSSVYNPADNKLMANGARITLSWPVPGLAPPESAQMVISESPGVFETNNRNCSRYIMIWTGTIAATSSTSENWYCPLKPDTDYYLNIRFTDQSNMPACINPGSGGWCWTFVDLIPTMF